MAAGVRRILAVTGEGRARLRARARRDRSSRAAEIAQDVAASSCPSASRRCCSASARSRSRSPSSSASSRPAAPRGIDAQLGTGPRHLRREGAGSEERGLRSGASCVSSAKQLRDRLGDSSIVLVGAVADGKAQLVLTVSKGLVAPLPRGRLDPTAGADRGRLRRRQAGHGPGRRHRDRGVWTRRSRPSTPASG